MAKKAAKKESTKKAAAEELDESAESDGGGGGKGKSLVIVESPAKANTIKKILGSNYQVKASVGHIRDLPKKKLGVTVEENFSPVYEVLSEKADVVRDLKEAATKVQTVYLAADPDREGEAIAWHTAELLKSEAKEIKRIVFHEITKNAVQEAIKHPRNIDFKLVDAQQARRVLDRLVGYKLSPLLWKKVSKGLSAGRVQSVAVRLICEREDEIEAFVPEEYWTIKAGLASKEKPNVTLTADLSKIDGKKQKIENGEQAKALVETLQTQDCFISKIGERTTSRKPVPPFITSTLQREASNRFGYGVKKTMQIAQKLYEGMETDEGHVGLITYMRTDSTRIAEEAQVEAKEFVLKQFGEKYYPQEPRVYESKKKKNVQDAHEAIRPSSAYRTPESLQNSLTPEQLKIYTLIWQRFVASQMESAEIKTKSIEATVQNITLRASHSKVIFPGYMIIYKSEEDLEEVEGELLPDLKEKDQLLVKQVDPKQHFTEAPPRFTEAMLVKTLEELGIGRPSTYAPTITTIQDRDYVLKEEKQLKPTELGRVVNRLLLENFPGVLDYQFTADLENKLDEIEDSGFSWQEVVGNFYFPFKEELEKAEKNMEKVVILIEGENCTDCGRPMQMKTSRWGSKFMGCTGYPECKSTRPLDKDLKATPEDKPTDEKCEKCGGAMVLKHGRFGEYLACSGEDCKTTRKHVVKTGVTCPECKTGELVQRKSRYGKFFYGCPNYPECKFALWSKPTGKNCPDCNSLTVEKNLKRGNFEACSSKECKWQIELEGPPSGEGESEGQEAVEA